jgi:hypothetical protein
VGQHFAGRGGETDTWNGESKNFPFFINFLVFILVFGKNRCKMATLVFWVRLNNQAKILCRANPFRTVLSGNITPLLEF